MSTVVENGEASVEGGTEAGAVCISAGRSDASRSTMDHEGCHARSVPTHAASCVAPPCARYPRAPVHSVDMRIAAFYLLLFLAQGLLSAAFGTLPAPDLFLIAMLTLLGRVAPWQLVLIGYGVGLLQDVTGFGFLGLHAIALAAAALTATIVRMQLTGSGLLERILIVVGAMTGKWLVVALLLSWLTGVQEDGVTLLAVAISETVLTVAVALLILPWSDALLKRMRMLGGETSP